MYCKINTPLDGLLIPCSHVWEFLDFEDKNFKNIKDEFKMFDSIVEKTVLFDDYKNMWYS